MSFFTDIKASFKESLGFFKPQELKNFFLLSLNTFKRAIKILFLELYGFWLFYLFLFMVIALVFGALGKNDYLNLFLYNPFNSVCSFLSILAVRASTERKDSAYFFRYMNCFFGYLFISLLCLYILPIGSIGCALAMLFFLDSENKFKSIFIALFNSIKMCCYYFPFLVVFPIVSMIMSLFIAQTTSFFSSIVIVHGVVVFWLFCMISTLFFVVSDLFLLSFLSTAYLKIIHSNPKLFFGASKKSENS